MDAYLQVEQNSLEMIDSSFHQNLLENLSDLNNSLERILVEDPSGPNSSNYFGHDMNEVYDSYNEAMIGLASFLNSLDSAAESLDAELENMEMTRQKLLEDRDDLMEMGHKLNCRVAYNTLVNKLEDSFTSLEKHTSEECARCFRDEAEDRLKRTNELIRVASMTSCNIDRDIFKEMEKITNLFENFERDRDMYVKELDLFSDVRRHKIINWMGETRTAEERELGENFLDYLSLTQRQRHMEVQVIKNALRMYSFNASLNFDREDNLRLMEELTVVQNKVNTMSGISKILPRAAMARTDLTCQDYDFPEEPDLSAGDMGTCEKKGKGLHRCPRKINLATDPITEPDVLAHLEAVLRWDERVGSPSHVQSNSCSEQPEAVVVSTESDPELTIKEADSMLGSFNTFPLLVEPSMELTAADDNKVVGAMADPIQTNARSAHSFLHPIESSTFLPGSGMKISNLVRKKHNSLRGVGSLTNMADIDTDSNLHQEEREVRSQGSQPAPRTRDHLTGASEHKRNMSGGGGSKDKEHDV